MQTQFEVKESNSEEGSDRTDEECPVNMHLDFKHLPYEIPPSRRRQDVRSPAGDLARPPKVC